MFQSNKKKILIFILIWLICLLITGGVWYFLNIQNKKGNNTYTPEYKDDKPKLRKDVPGITIFDRYDENDLVVEKVNENKVNYYKISGLKNKEIENKINKEIEEKCKSLLTPSGEVYSYVTANFGNILSVSCTDKGTTYFNYDLTTGNQLKLEDLFTNNANMYAILASAFNNSISLGIGYKELYDENSNSFDDKKYAEVEDKVFKVINEIKAGNYRFSINNNRIDVRVGEEYAEVGVSDYAEYLAYYNRFKTEDSIYEQQNIGKKNLLVTSFFSSDMYLLYRFDEIGDYAFIDYAAPDWQAGISYDAAKEVFSKSDIAKKINELEQQLDKNKFTYINSTIDIGYFDDYEIYTVNTLELRKCVFNKNEYYNGIREEIYRSKTSFGGGFYNPGYYDSTGAKCTTIDFSPNYFNASLNKISSVQDIFKSGVNYNEVLKGLYKDYIAKTYPEVTDESLIDNILSTLTYELNIQHHGISIVGEYGETEINFDTIKDYLDI